MIEFQTLHRNNMPQLAFTKQPSSPKLHTTISNNTTIPTPPIAKREEDQVVYAGVLPTAQSSSSSSSLKNLRQAKSSTYPLLNPPRPITDPYGWIHDEK